MLTNLQALPGEIDSSWGSSLSILQKMEPVLTVWCYHLHHIIFIRVYLRSSAVKKILSIGNSVISD
jgi:hypothetical protein